MAGIDACKVGNKFSLIGQKISEVAQNEGFFVDEYFCGHGIGKFLHMKPLISHNINEESLVMEEGMVFTIEPILTMFPVTENNIYCWPDKWTISCDNNPSAQFEHMVLINQSGVEVLTVCD